MKTLLALVLFTGLCGAAELCPHGAAEVSKGVAAGVEWQVYERQYPSPKHCIASTLTAQTTVSWRAAGIENAAVRGRLGVSLCCFDRVHGESGAITAGEIQSNAWSIRPAAEGAGNHKEGFPDLIEEDARVSTIEIRGTLWDGSKSVRVDLLLKCSASQFAKEYAYQFTITDRSPDPIRLDWNLLDDLRSGLKPSVQVSGLTRTLLFLTKAEPQETESLFEITSLGGILLGKFHAPGFTSRKSEH